MRPSVSLLELARFELGELVGELRCFDTFIVYVPILNGVAMSRGCQETRTIW
jgi:hypothetical protein